MQKILRTSSKTFLITFVVVIFVAFISDVLEGKVGSDLAFPLRLLPTITIWIFILAIIIQLIVSYSALIWRKARFRNFDIWMFVFAHVFGFFILVSALLIRPFSGVLG